MINRFLWARILWQEPNYPQWESPQDKNVIASSYIVENVEKLSTMVR